MILRNGYRIIAVNLIREYMRTYAYICLHMLTYAYICVHMLTYAYIECMTSPFR